MATRAELLAAAVLIRDETRTNANTAARVGGALYNYATTVALEPYDVTQATFGAVGDGVTDDTDAIVAAIAAGAATGRPVTGVGGTYGVSGNIELPANVWLQDITLKQLDPADDERTTLYSEGASNIRLERVKVNRNGDGTAGLLNFAAGIYIGRDGNGGSGHRFEDVEVYGDDIGTGFRIRGASNFDCVRLHCHDINYLLVADPGDDSVQGFWFQDSAGFRVMSPTVHDLGGDFGGGSTPKYSRSPITGCSDFTVSGGEIWNVDQGLDLTGSSGNERFIVTGMLVRDCYTVGFKFANSTRDGTVTGCVAERCGRFGFVVSGPAESGQTVFSSDIDFVGCTAYDTGSNGVWGVTHAVAGFQTIDGDFDIGSTRGVRFINCKSHDRQSVPTCEYGFLNTVALVGTDGRYNECVGCVSIGHTVAAFQEFHESRCVVRRSSAFSIPNNSWEAIEWNDDDDYGGLHDNSSNPATFFVRRDGVYKVTFGVDFAASATGVRGVRVIHEGSGVKGSTMLVSAASADETSLNVTCEVRATAGEYIFAQAFQTSGGPLNVQTTSGGVVEQIA
jgi:hypothetical protein